MSRVESIGSMRLPFDISLNPISFTWQDSIPLARQQPQLKALIYALNLPAATDIKVGMNEAVTMCKLWGWSRCRTRNLRALIFHDPSVAIAGKLNIPSLREFLIRIVLPRLSENKGATNGSKWLILSFNILHASTSKENRYYCLWKLAVKKICCTAAWQLLQSKYIDVYIKRSNIKQEKDGGGALIRNLSP
jgi:hypothetical protein